MGQVAEISLRAATEADADYCLALYFIGNATYIRDLGLDTARQVASFRQQWKPEEMRVIQGASTDVGWLQVSPRGDESYLAQIFLEPTRQGQGIGTAVLTRLIEDAAKAGKSVSLGVIKSNPALRLYRRLGFVETHEDEYKIYMRRR